MSKEETNHAIEPSRIAVQPETIVTSEQTIVTDLTRKCLFAAGIIAILLGIIAFAFPKQVLASMSALFALFSLFVAIIDLMLVTKSQTLKGAFLMSALLATTMSLIFLFRQDVTSQFIGLIFGFWILLNATAILAQMWSPELLAGWQRLVGLVLGLTSLAMGLYLSLVPDIAANTMSLVVGSFADLLGIYFILIALFSRKN